MISKVLVKKAIKRKEGFVYFVDSEGNVCEGEDLRKKKEGKHEIQRS